MKATDAAPVTEGKTISPEPEATTFTVDTTSTSGMYTHDPNTDTVITKTGDGYLARITLNNGKSKYAYVSETAPTGDTSEKYYVNEGTADHAVYSIPVELDKANKIWFTTKEDYSSWSSKAWEYTFDSSTMKATDADPVTEGQTISPEPDETPTPTPTETPTPTPTETPTPEDPDRIPYNGDKVKFIAADGSDFGMYIAQDGTSIKIEGNSVKIVFYPKNTTVYTSFGYGSFDDTSIKSEVSLDTKNAFVFSVSKDLCGYAVPVHPINSRTGAGTSKQYYLAIPAEGYITGDITPTPTPTSTPTPKPTATPTAAPKPTATPKPTKDIVVADDGEYDNVKTTTTGKMFRVVGAKLKSIKDVMTAIITLSGTGYTRMYAGTAEDAPNDKANWKYYLGKSSKTGEGYYFEVPVAELDKDLPFAAFSEKNQIWYQRTINFSSLGIPTHIVKAEVPEEEKETTPTPTPTPTPTEKPADNNGTTSAQDTSTTLADGTYTPDSFSFSGGTGKLQISCTKITVRGGKTYATLHFSSPHVQYVKANGSTYYLSGQDVEIPVVLNKNMKIIALTTAMSQPHEITYSIYIGLAAAGAAGDGQTAIETTVGDQYEKLDETAPSIAGLAFAGETATEKSDLLKIYKYTDEAKDTFTLVEIDMVKNTAKDPKWLEEHPEAADLTNAENEAAPAEEAPAPAEEAEAAEEEAANAAEEPANAEEKEADAAATLDEQKIALYEKDIVKYLIVPEGKEVPVGLDKLVVIIQQPADKSYAATAGEIEMLDELELTDSIAAVGVEKEDITVEKVREALEKEEIAFGGTYDDLDSRELIKAEANFAMQSSALLPKKESEIESSEEAIHKLANRAVMMKMPAIVMRNDEEEDEEAAAEWYKVLGAVYGAEEKAQKVYDEKIAALKEE